ncbi:MAG: S1 family peptidase [Candidatus Ancillula sp.]|jgi:hypothetical protein|nr:S1 family peptidase [Candidatus Ancillula sp.]
MTSEKLMTKEIERFNPDYKQWESDFGSLVTYSKTHYSDKYAYSIEDPKKPYGLIAFKNGVPEEIKNVQKSIAGLEFIENTGFTDDEQYHASIEISNSIKCEDLGLKACQIIVTPDSSNSSFDVDIVSLVTRNNQSLSAQTDNNYMLPSILMDINDKLTSKVRVISSVFNVDKIAISDDNSKKIEQQALDAGGNLYYKNGGMCTSAFSVKKNDSDQLGILTAAHCPGAENIEFYSSRTIGNIFEPDQPYSNIMDPDAVNGGDFRWLWSSVGLTGDTIIGPREVRKFPHFVVPSIDKPVCTYGSVSGQSCAYIDSGNIVSKACTSDGTCYTIGGLWSTDGPITQKGDSGGPWYTGDVAVGITSGANIEHSYFSLVYNAQIKMGVSLWY